MSGTEFTGGVEGVSGTGFGGGTEGKNGFFGVCVTGGTGGTLFPGGPLFCKFGCVEVCGT